MNIETKNKINCSINIRLPKEDKKYYENKLKCFVELFNNNKLLSIQFGKQDIRGIESITFVDLKHCVSLQKHFFNKFELLGFVCGFVEMNELKYSLFNEYLRVLN